MSHLAQSIFPTLIGIICLIERQSSSRRLLLSGLLVAFSTWIMLPLHPGWICRSNCVPIEISNNTLTVPKNTAKNVENLRRYINLFTAERKKNFVAPFWPAAYSLFETRSPVWETYAVYPRTKELEEMEIARLKENEIDFVFLLDIPLDGHEELRYKHTHPLTRQYITTNFEPIFHKLGPIFKLYCSKGARKRSNALSPSN